MGAVAVFGPLLFTLDWVLLGWSHRGYVPRQETISALSAHDVPGWPWMVTGQLALGAGLAALAVLAVRAWGRPGWWPAGFAVIAAYGTVQASAFRTICNRADVGWCTPLPRSAYPRSQWLHGTGTGLAFGGVLLACLATAVVAAGAGDGWGDVARWSLAVEVVALPNVAWFLANAETRWHGLAEKVFLVALAGWVSWCGYRLPRGARSQASPPTAQTAWP
jgi:Protein of unknown function (DUF998)